MLIEPLNRCSGRTYGWTTKPYQPAAATAAGRASASPPSRADPPFYDIDEDLSNIPEGVESGDPIPPLAQRRDGGARSAGGWAGDAVRSHTNSDMANLMADEFKQGIGIHDDDDDLEENPAPLRMHPQAEVSFGN